MQVIGLCRFSYPAIGGFQIEHNSVEERRRYLYSPARLEERFRLFETVTLPSYQDHTDEDFQFLIVIGDCLPKEAFERLNDLTTGMKQIRIIKRQPGRHRKVMNEVLNQARSDPDQPCLQYRHDDDDAVSVDFVERLRLAADDCAGLLAANKTVALDFSCGFMAQLDDQGIQAAQTHRRLITAGLGMYVRGGCTLSIMNFAHHKMDRVMPVISYPDAPMWVRTLNGFNDSPMIRKNKMELSPLSPDLEGELIARFAIDPARVRQVFATAP